MKDPEPWTVVTAYSKDGDGGMEILTFGSETEARARYDKLDPHEPKMIFKGHPADSLHCDESPHVAVERTKEGFLASIPDVPGLLIEADTEEEALVLIRQVLADYLKAKQEGKIR